MSELPVETPAAVVDLDRLEENLRRWQAHCDQLGLASRPHVKTHKCTMIARQQLELGAAGLTCQTLGEAEAMAAAGFLDLLIPTNIVGAAKLERLSALLGRAIVTVSVDDESLVGSLDEAASSSGRELGVLVECDTGGHRTGVSTPDAAAAVARAVARSRSLRFAGFLTYPSSAETRTFLAAAVDAATNAGLEVRVVSAGGTPTMWRAAELLPTVTEYRAGSYAFNDRKIVAAGAATKDECALTVAATVVSRPAPRRAILDAGSKALTSDLAHDNRFGFLPDAPGSRLHRLDEEHGYVELADGEELEVGRQVRIIPNHACVVPNLFDELVLERGGTLAGRWAVDARSR